MRMQSSACTGVTQQVRMSLLKGTELCRRARGAVRGGARRADAGVVEQRVGRDAPLADARIHAPGALRDAAGIAARSTAHPHHKGMLRSED